MHEEKQAKMANVSIVSTPPGLLLENLQATRPRLRVTHPLTREVMP
jgi:hypothetical protein